LRSIFIFTSDRKEIITAIKEGKEPDTALRGLNYMPCAEYRKIDIPRAGAGAFLVWFVKQMPILLHLLRYDFVVASDTLPFGYVVSVLARIFHRKTRWIYIAMNSSTLIRRHTAHRIRLSILKRFWKSYFRIVCLSHKQIEDFVSLGIARERLVFVPFGVDVNFYATHTKTHKEDLIVSVGRDTGRDYETLLTAARHLPSQEFVIVAMHRNFSKEVSVPENVSIHYNLSATEVRTLYARARIVIVPSKADDTNIGSDCSGQTAVLDAMAAGKPVIATERAWMKDYFTHDKELFVIPPQNPARLSMSIEKLWYDNDLCERLSTAGHRKTRKYYTTKIFAQELQKIVTTV